MSINYTPRTWVAGEIITAAFMNTEIRDAFTGLQAAWTTYTPTAVNFTVGNGTLRGRYLQRGKSIDIRINFNAGSTSSYAASGHTVSLPVAAHGTDEQGLPAKLFASTAINVVGQLTIAASGTVGQIYWPTSSANGALIPETNTSLNAGTTGNWNARNTYETA